MLALTLVGWAVMGLGLCGGVPQVFTAAGNLAGGAGKALSRVVGTGYLAFLAGPGVIGWLADRSSLNAAFLLPLWLFTDRNRAAGFANFFLGPAAMMSMFFFRKLRTISSESSSERLS